MHNIKDIRKNFEEFKKSMQLRNVDLDFENILSLDEENRNLIREKESLEMEKKNISKNKDSKLFSKSKEISYKIDDLSKKQSSIKINVKGREFKIENFYEGIVRCDFNQLCDQNLGAEDYLEIIKNCKFMVIDQIPQFNDVNSNQQQRFITLLDVIYDKNISLAVTADINLDQFTSSRLLEKPFKRTISRLYELTSNEYN